MAFINKDIEPRIFSLLWLCLNHFSSLRFTKNLKPKQFAALAGMRSSAFADKMGHIENY
jgi:hypothetical protein